MMSYRRSFVIGLAGFLLAGIAANLATWLIFGSGVLKLILKIVPQDQPLVRLVAGILLVFIGLGVGGAAGGLLRGATLQRIDAQGSRKRYLTGGAFSQGIAYGILVIPTLLFISLLNMYNVGSATDPKSFVVLFALIGGLFGLISGLILALLTLRLRYIWLPWLANIVGGVLGGALIGLLIWHPQWIANSANKVLAVGLFLVVSGLCLSGIAGGMLGLSYEWLSRKRQAKAVDIAPRRWQDIATITIGSLVFLVIMSFTNTIVNFVTIHQGSISTSLESLTEGVHWQAAQSVGTDPVGDALVAPGLAAGTSGPVLAWSGADQEVYFAYPLAQGGAPAWSTPLNVSNSPQAASLHPQVALSPDGAAYVAWAEAGVIAYSRCKDGACSAPLTLATPAETCPPAAQGIPGDWPAIAVTGSDAVFVAWKAGPGVIAYTRFPAGQASAALSSGCLVTPGLAEPQPRLAALSAENVRLVVSAPAGAGAGPVLVSTYQDAAWSETQTAGQGTAAGLAIDAGGRMHLAWCGSEQELIYQVEGGAPETLAPAGCPTRPALVEDSQGRMHLLYASQELPDNFGEARNFTALAEMIRQESGWTSPAIVVQTAAASALSTTRSPDGVLHLAYSGQSGDAPAMQVASQPVYACDATGLVPAARAMLAVIESGQFHPTDYRSPYCGNRFVEIVHMPRPLPRYADLATGEKNGFDQLANLLTNAHYEVLFSNMQWDPDVNELSPGFRQAEAAAALYQSIKANPSAYPRGLTVRVLLGNYPNLASLQYGDQIWGLVQDLVNAGVETMEDPSIGWKLEVANYAGSFPHSHTKFVVLDGRSIMTAGFNISWFHLPKENPSGKGDNLTDLGLVMSGPVAQTGIMVFDDMWEGANQLVCPDLQAKDLQKSCKWQKATVSHTPEVLRYDVQDSPDDAFAIYRTGDYKEADHAYVAALESATDTIDAMHVNFSADMICLVNLFSPGVCDFNNALPYMEGLVDAAANGAHLRIIVENANSNGLENRVGIQILQDELARRGISDRVEIRYFDGRLHAKSALIDRQLLIIGSQNFHYSSFSPGGLLEFSGATTSPAAIETYQQMFDGYWELAVPSADAVWGTSGE